MSQGFGYPTFPVDTHIHRLAQRWGKHQWKGCDTNRKRFETSISKKYWNKLSFEIIYYGREFCNTRMLWNIL